MRGKQSQESVHRLSHDICTKNTVLQEHFCTSSTINLCNSGFCIIAMTLDFFQQSPEIIDTFVKVKDFVSIANQILANLLSSLVINKNLVRSFNQITTSSHIIMTSGDSLEISTNGRNQIIRTTLESTDILSTKVVSVEPLTLNIIRIVRSDNAVRSGKYQRLLGDSINRSIQRDGSVQGQDGIVVHGVHHNFYQPFFSSKNLQ